MTLQQHMIHAIHTKAPYILLLTNGIPQVQRRTPTKVSEFNAIYQEFKAYLQEAVTYQVKEAYTP